MPDLSVNFAGMHFPNPFMLASAPPTRNAEMIKRAFAAGWGGAVTKSITLEPARDLQPRLHPLRHGKRNVGMENIELVSQLTVEEWLHGISEIKSAYPDRPLWASIIAPSVKADWQRLTEAVQEAGPDALELNVSCPHGMPGKGMGAFIGQNDMLTGEVVAWVKEVAKAPIVVKLTPNVTDIAFIARAAKENGADALSAINTVSGLIGVDLDTLTPLPAVGEVSTYGGYSGPAIKPIALRCVAQIAKATGLPVSGLGGLSTWEDAVEFMAVGASTVQVGTAAMWGGYGVVEKLVRGLNHYLDGKEFPDLSPVIGAALPKIVEFQEIPLTIRARARADDTCDGCLLCVTACADGGFNAISGVKGEVVTIDGAKCDGCGLCVMVCPTGSIAMVPRPLFH
ncbi:MAG: NAD-dependent dihydropyrimidine dehydrogenase subunit PreA [Deltaproteobacteria bacterium]|nr:NAD-dependent dihydropyrimidine dehydrogenase subunit PreA [Deltaproteobacteria bacterium]